MAAQIERLPEAGVRPTTLSLLPLRPPSVAAGTPFKAFFPKITGQGLEGWTLASYVLFLGTCKYRKPRSANGVLSPCIML
jgi:hypothetical protein